MPQYLSRAQDWFGARDRGEKAGIVVLAFIILLAASRVLAVVATLAFLAVVVVLIVQLFRRRPVRTWIIAAVGSLAAVVLFSGISGAIYGPQTGQGGQGERVEERAEKPLQQEPERTKLEEAKPPPPKEQAEKREAAVQPGGQDQKPENAVQNGDPDNDGVEDEEQPDPAANPTDDEPESSPRATVRFTRVVDGDTIEISPAVDGKDTVRLIGIDAPEEAKPGCGPQPLAEEAAGQLANWEGSEVELEFDEERTDRYGRLLAYVRDDSIGIMLNEDMLLSGYVQLYIVPPNTKYEGKLREAQQESKPSPIFGESIWSLPSAEQAQLADRGNGVGSGDGACPAVAQSSASASASASASPQPDPEPNRNRGRRNAPDYNAPSSPAPDGGGGGGCPPGAIPVPPGDDRDGDGDGCAGE